MLLLGRNPQKILIWFCSSLELYRVLWASFSSLFGPQTQIFNTLFPAVAGSCFLLSGGQKCDKLMLMFLWLRNIIITFVLLAFHSVPEVPVNFAILYHFYCWVSSSMLIIPQPSCCGLQNLNLQIGFMMKILMENAWSDLSMHVFLIGPSCFFLLFSVIYCVNVACMPHPSEGSAAFPSYPLH